MSVGKIARRFEALGQVPVEISDVVKEVNDLLFDEYVCVHGVSDDSTIRGICYQSRPAPLPGSAIRPMVEHRVIYNTSIDKPYQRLAVCKELVHILDDEKVKTKTRKGVEYLIEKVRKRETAINLSSPNGIMFFIEKLAEFQAVAVLFPLGYWEMVYPKYARGEITIEEIAGVLQIPEEYVAVTMTEQWLYMRETFLFD